jgi:hypothetical protein
MENQEKITQLENKLRQVLEAYSIIEEYACLLVGSDCAENETITYANSIVEIALSIDNE